MFRGGERETRLLMHPCPRPRGRFPSQVLVNYVPRDSLLHLLACPLRSSSPPQIFSSTSTTPSSTPALQMSSSTSPALGEPATSCTESSSSVQSVLAYLISLHAHFSQGFFTSLFTAGFLESSNSAGLQHVDIVFDDRNITRPGASPPHLSDHLTHYPSTAFEYVRPLLSSSAAHLTLFRICIARLYGGGPPLHVSPALIPSALHPLTPSFPGPAPPSDLPRDHHPATPSFLLSLLATSVYLSIPSLASQALACILNTVGPYTVIPYLQFATGSTFDFHTEHDLDAAVGLEHIAEILEPSDSPSPSDCHDILADKLHDLDVQKEDPADSDPESEPSERSRLSPSFNYGAVSDKIGEAAACWLARWAPDMLLHEERASRVRDSPLAPIPTQPPVPRRRADTLPSRPSIDESSPPTPHRIPLIWARGGLTSAWIRELVSSDALFVRGERERYDLARAVVELRRRQAIDDDEEEDWEIMFRDGIYYTNMVS